MRAERVAGRLALLLTLTFALLAPLAPRAARAQLAPFDPADGADPAASRGCVNWASRRAQAAAPGTAAADPGWSALDSAYRALRQRDLDGAVACFEATLAYLRARPDVRKDLAYTYLRIGRTELARRQFALLVAADSADERARLELAFLDFEQPEVTGRARAHRLFAELRTARDPAIRARATTTFAAIDTALGERIARLQAALADAADPYATLGELGVAFEERGQPAPAEASYARQLARDPSRPMVYLALARAQRAQGQPERARATLRTAAASIDAYVSELARDALAADRPTALPTPPAGNGRARAPLTGFADRSGDGTWDAALLAAGFPRVPAAQAALHVVAARDTSDWLAAVRTGATVLLTGPSAIAERFGIRATGDSVAVRREADVHGGDQLVLWSEPRVVPVVRLPAGAAVFTRERWSGAPLLVGVRVGRGAVLWAVAPPGPRGFERLPFLPQALAALDVTPGVAARRLHAFFDYGYRSRADVAYLARGWRRMGVGTLHVASWHFVEPDSARDAYVRTLIDAAHRQGIRVYAWLELPHVSDKFWADHPEWRERDGSGRDAVVFWRRPINLLHPDARAEARRVVGAMLRRFDWDGANLSELYFEGLRGLGDPSHLTPFNDDVRREVQQRHGFDPLALLDPRSPIFHARAPDRLRAFQAYRVELQHRLHADWLEFLDEVRRERRGFGIVVCYVDDVSEPSMRERIGADVRGLLPLIRRHDATLLVQDPFVLWPLGPERYARIAREYDALPEAGAREAVPARLAIDLNIVPRLANVFPTDHQTGTELLQLVRTAQLSFPWVALYGEQSVLPPDRALLAAASALATVVATSADGGQLTIESPHGLGVRWAGGVRVDGAAWPWHDGAMAWLPAGRFTLTRAPTLPATRLLDFNGEVRALTVTPRGWRLRYAAETRAIAVLSRAPVAVRVDGRRDATPWLTDGARTTLLLPAGVHEVEIDVP